MTKQIAVRQTLRQTTASIHAVCFVGTNSSSSSSVDRAL